MTEEEYNNKLDAITAVVALYVLRRSKTFRARALTTDQWLEYLGGMWTIVRDARIEASKVARDFYDAERVRVLGLDPFPQSLQPSSFEQFVQNMEPVRVQMSKANATQSTSLAVSHLAVREVHNAARGQVIRSVAQDEPLDNVVSMQERDFPEKHSVDIESTMGDNVTPYDIKTIDPVNRLVRGWARVATGAETCEWCLMLVGRGPVYRTALSAGSKFTEDTALRMHASGDEDAGAIKKWHPGCDCRVVPVFKISQWSGRHAWKAADDAWKEASKEAAGLQRTDPLEHKRGKNKGKPFTIGERTLLVLRHQLLRGDVSMKELTAG